MRASLYLVGFAAASLMGIGVVEVGCSSSSSSAPTPTTDAATDDAAAGDDADDSAVACTPLPINSATFDAGSPIWSCLQAACGPSLATCATDCVCNNAVLAALSCQADGGTSTTCFTPVASTDTAGGAVITCLLAKTAGCGLVLDGGTDAASDATVPTGDAGDAATTAPDASDAAAE